MIYPVDSLIQFLKDWGLISRLITETNCAIIHRIDIFIQWTVDSVIIIQRLNNWDQLESTAQL